MSQGPIQSDDLAITINASQRLVILKALSDPRRMEIIERLGSSENTLACGAMLDCLPISAATLSHHLKELENANLIRIERQGKFARIHLRRDIWNAFLADLARL